MRASWRLGSCVKTAAQIATLASLRLEPPKPNNLLFPSQMHELGEDTLAATSARAEAAMVANATEVNATGSIGAEAAIISLVRREERGEVA